MQKRSKYFLGLTILTIALFVFCCFSIIFNVIKMSSLPEDKRVENFMAFAYLFLHLIICAVLIFYALKSYLVKDQILSIFMTLENGKKNPKAYRNTLIFSIIFGILFVFFFLNSFGIINVLSFFSLGLNLALTNLNLTVFSIALYMYFYRPASLDKIAAEIAEDK